MVSSVLSATNSAYLTATGTPARAAVAVSASTSFSDALADATAQGTIVSLSEKAKAAAGSQSTTAAISAQAQADAAAQIASLDIYKASSNLKFDDYKNFYATEAAAVSASQGLPAGQYDFTKLSPKEARIVTFDAQQNHGASYDDVRALYSYFNAGTTNLGGSAYTISDTPGDVLSAALNMQMTTHGVDGAGYAAPKASIQWMLNSQGTSVSPDLQQSLASALSATPSTSLQGSASTSAPVTAQTKAAAAAQVASFDLNFTNMGKSQAEYSAYYAAGAAAVSASQGLPAGQYDFSKLSPKEAMIVAGDAGANHGASFDDVAGLSEYALMGTTFTANSYSVSNTPKDALSSVAEMSLTTRSVNGNDFNDTLNWMLSLQAAKISASAQKAIDTAFAAYSTTSQRALA
ncbi:hypothetical protein [Novosphingobium terrae]|uniref:hypothetical protein n=1 Tax=Novosphingobium terrae TaxID=2726189 RepID=UPI00197E0E1B|nr:hypothetical protein [Novosphingobium terrae]